jgi:hypothetical protein
LINKNNQLNLKVYTGGYIPTTEFNCTVSQLRHGDILLRPPVPLLRGRERNDSDCGENCGKKSLKKDIIYNNSIIEWFDNRNI